MRKIFLIGVVAQIIIVIISLVLKDYQIIKKGNFILLGVTTFLAGAGAKGSFIPGEVRFKISSFYSP